MNNALKPLVILWIVSLIILLLDMVGIVYIKNIQKTVSISNIIIFGIIFFISYMTAMITGFDRFILKHD